jgi:lysophospholipase L1-like esterase
MDEVSFKLRFNLYKRIASPGYRDYAGIAPIIGGSMGRVREIDESFSGIVRKAAARLAEEAGTFDEILDRQVKVLFVGDSNTSSRLSYMHILEDYFYSNRQILLIDEAVSCEKSTEAVFELYPRVVTKKPDIVSIMIGSNGVRQPDHPEAKPIVSPEQFREHLVYMANRLEDLGALIILNTLPVMDPEKIRRWDDNHQTVDPRAMEDYNRVVRDVAGQHGAALHDAAKVLGACELKTVLDEDGIHLNDPGQYETAKSLLKILLPLIKTISRRSPSKNPL